MQYNFLNAFQHLKNRQDPATGVWLMHGHEELLSQWLIEKMSPNWRQHNMTISRMDITSAKSWQAVLAELSSMSLFDDNKAIIVHGNHKPDKEALAELAQFATSNSSNCLVIKKAKAVRFFRFATNLVTSSNAIFIKSSNANNCYSNTPKILGSSSPNPLGRY